VLVDDTQNKANNLRVPGSRSPEPAVVEDQICEATPLVGSQKSNKNQDTCHESSAMVTMVTHLPDDTIKTSEIVNLPSIHTNPRSHSLVPDIAPPPYMSTSGNFKRSKDYKKIIYRLPKRKNLGFAKLISMVLL
jgi:hypothetical protein